MRAVVQARQRALPALRRARQQRGGDARGRVPGIARCGLARRLRAQILRCVRLTRLFWPLLKASQGSVVNIVGGAARTPDAEFLIGGSVNAAVANFSKGLSKLG